MIFLQVRTLWHIPKNLWSVARLWSLCHWAKKVCWISVCLLRKMLKCSCFQGVFRWSILINDENVMICYNILHAMNHHNALVLWTVGCGLWNTTYIKYHFLNLWRFVWMACWCKFRFIKAAIEKSTLSVFIYFFSCSHFYLISDATFLASCLKWTGC